MSSKGYKQTEEHIEKRLKNQSNWKRGRFWLGKHLPDEMKKKISEDHKTNSTTRRGAEHHNWKGGVTPEHNKMRNSPEYIKWRDEVYKKDKFICQDCGIHCNKGNIVAHHLIFFADKPELRYLIENGQVLCRPCHARIHKDELLIAQAIRRQRVFNIVHI